MSDARWSGIRELTPQERRDALAEKLGLDEETREVLDAGPALPIDRANSRLKMSTASSACRLVWVSTSLLTVSLDSSPWQLKNLRLLQRRPTLHATP